LLLDTCAIIWIGQGQTIQRVAQEAVTDRLRVGAVFVSPFSAWELSLLVARGRLGLPVEVEAWFEAFAGQSGISLAALSPRILVAAHQLPGTPPNDPADRILIATARQSGLAIVTRDRRILDYGAAGLVKTVEC
jgi:PIN domain nuclease of toxin-antitoxin system